MKRIFSLQLLLLLTLPALLVVSCDYENQPFENLGDGVDTTGQETQYNDTTWNDTTASYRTIVIEDYTGHTCGNCPAAANIASNLHDQYGDTVLVAGIHAGGFAVPYTTGSKYLTDFRTPAGNEYDQTFSVSNIGNPNGIISRRGYPGNVVISPTSWGSNIANLVADPAFMSPAVTMDLRNIYNTVSRNNEIKATITVEEPVSGSCNILVWVLESGLTDWQKDYSKPSGQQDVSDYTHHHVLRKAVPGTWGDLLISGGAVPGNQFEKTFTIKLDETWDESNTTIMVVVYDVATYEILQAGEVHVGH